MNPKTDNQYWMKRNFLKALGALLPIFLITCDLFEEEHPFQGITVTTVDSLGNMIILKEDPDDWRIQYRPEPDPGPPLLDEIGPSFPNPAVDSTTILSALEESTFVFIWIVDRDQKVVKTLVNKGRQAGYWKDVWYREDDSGRRVAADTYRCKYQWFRQKSVDSVLTLVEAYGHGDIRVE
ncbi:MAG: hypothetical protein ACETWG_10675 [Candidatus Neomarinimicrobiota bacterium]